MKAEEKGEVFEYVYEYIITTTTHRNTYVYLLE